MDGNLFAAGSSPRVTVWPPQIDHPVQRPTANTGLRPPGFQQTGPPRGSQEDLQTKNRPLGPRTTMKAPIPLPRPATAPTNITPTLLPPQRWPPRLAVPPEVSPLPGRNRPPNTGTAPLQGRIDLPTGLTPLPRGTGQGLFHLPPHRPDAFRLGNARFAPFHRLHLAPFALYSPVHLAPRAPLGRSVPGAPSIPLPHRPSVHSDPEPEAGSPAPASEGGCPSFGLAGKGS